MSDDSGAESDGLDAPGLNDFNRVFDNLLEGNVNEEHQVVDDDSSDLSIDSGLDATDDLQFDINLRQRGFQIPNTGGKCIKSYCALTTQQHSLYLFRTVCLSRIRASFV